MDNTEFYDEIIKEAAEGPLGGYGKPFTDDPLATSQFSGPGPNPAAATGPYNAETDPSINNVGPYTGPEETNPASDTAPYARPGSPSAVRAAYINWSDQTGWFDGESDSIYSRIVEAEHLQSLARTAGVLDVEEALDEKIEQLRRVASEYDNSILQEHMNTVPGGTVALEYDNPIDGGLVDLGIGDTESWIYAEAAKVVKEARDYDWHAFKFEGARRWVEQKTQTNPGMLRHGLDTRKAAVDFARDKTMILLDPVRRAEIIDGFVNSTERYRREAVVIAERAEQERERAELQRQAILHHHEVEAAYEDFDDSPLSPSVAVPPDFVDGQLDIGGDDGSSLYYDAREVISRFQDVDLQAEVIRWTQAKAEDSPGMFEHPEIFRRAAFEFAREKTAMVFDPVERQQKVAGFIEAADVMRQDHLVKQEVAVQKTAGRKTAEEVEFESLQEILDDGEEPSLW